MLSLRSTDERKLALDIMDGELVVETVRDADVVEDGAITTLLVVLRTLEVDWKLVFCTAVTKVSDGRELRICILPD